VYDAAEGAGDMDFIVGGVDLNAMEAAGALGLGGWSHRLMHVDWGDGSMPTRDGGFETMGLIYSNLEEPGDVAFTDASMTIASETIRPWFTMTGFDHDADAATDEIMAATINADAVDGAQTVPAANIMVAVGGLNELERDIENTGVLRGTYFGAMGTLYCVDGTNCRISRDVGDTLFTAVEGDWRFVPDDGAMVTLPDQDWLAFGLWLTAPDDMVNGVHRAGVFYDGMDT